MAAAAYRSRGVAGVKATKGLFFFFTLLCLVGLARSHIDKNKLEKLKEDFQKSQQTIENVKANQKSVMDSFSDTMNEKMILMDQMTALAKKLSEDFPDDFSPMEGLLQNLKDFMEKVKTYIEELNEKLGDKIENTEQYIREMGKLLELFEEQHAEL